ncbi:MAG: ABC transporter permease [Pyrinomonadaceae bacterium]|nr:ABC transporter permease [Pyrinomonadaceae bacterium]
MLRQAVRTLFRKPMAAALIVATMAVGIGTNVAVFSVADAVLLQRFQYPSAGELVRVAGNDVHFGQTPFSFLDFQDWCSSQNTFAGISAYTLDDFSVKIGANSPTRISAAIITDNYFQILGLAPPLGRSFTKTENRQMVNPVPVILTDGFWRKNFSESPKVLGQSFLLNGSLCEVVGVAPPGIEHPPNVEVFLPVGILSQTADYNDRENRRFYGIGRLLKNRTAAQAETDLQHIAANLARTYPHTNAGISVILSPELDPSLRNYRTSLYLLIGAAGAVLLIATINIINLRLTQISTRSYEWGIRAALAAC